MFNLRRVLLGRRLASGDTQHTKVNNFVGLAVFSSDALSSVAYATQEIMASLSMAIPHGAAVLAAGAIVHPLFGLSVPVAFGIVGLLWVLGISYRQTILAYPTGGGAYIVAKENIGETAALVAGASLLIDYVLTVATSVASGVAAITAAIPALEGRNVLITLAAIAFIAVANLRGVKESGALFSIPTYGFVVLIMILLAVGISRWILGAPSAVPVQQAFSPAHQVSGLAMVWIFMRAFSAGCTALTGVEAISNGVQAFQDPPERNASKTMLWMVLLLGSMFLGITLLAHRFGIVYAHSPDPAIVAETLLSKLAKAVYGDVAHGLPKLMYYLTQGFTFAILVVAANTAYADFPRLAALIGRDGYMPKQFASQGDRLVFSNGIFILTGLSFALVWLLHANTDLLLPLYALGVFTGFTISQAGMVVHWIRLRDAEPHWLRKAAVNGLGMLTSGVVMADIVITKFLHGAWLVVVLIPLLVWVFQRIHRHYIGVQAKLAASRSDAFAHSKHHALVLVSGIHQGVVEALGYARLIAGDRVEALAVDLGGDEFSEGPGMTKLRADWVAYGMGVPLRRIPSPFRKIVEPVLKEVDRFQRAEPEVCLTVILPEFVTPKWWQRILHNQTALRVKAALASKPGVIVTSVRVHLPD
jgi:amino acid transporter